MEKKTALDYLEKAYSSLQEKKPNDRSERDRLYAIALTDIEKVMVWVRAMEL